MFPIYYLSLYVSALCRVRKVCRSQLYLVGMKIQQEEEGHAFGIRQDFSSDGLQYVKFDVTKMFCLYYQ